MIKDGEPYLIEYNVRMGDPECQTTLPLLQNDFVDVLESCMNSTLDEIDLIWKKKKSICIVLTSKGYPDKYKKNILINNLEYHQNKDKEFIFHAGTKKLNNKFYSNGGRVLNFVSIDDNFVNARKKSLDQIKKLNWEDGYYRSDIGHKVIENS